MILRQTLVEPTNGYWDDGKKQVFDWRIDGTPKKDSKGEFIRVGSWSANCWFHVALGKTEKLTLSYAKKHLKAVTRVPIKSFEYLSD